MSKILKAANVIIDENNRVSIDVLDLATLEERVSQELSVEKPAAQKDPEPDIPPEELAEDIVEQAREEARQIIENAREEASRLIEERRAAFDEELRILQEETLNEAQETGYAKGYDESVGLRTQAEQVLKDAAATKEEMIKNTEPEITTLVCRIVNKLTADAADLNPQVVNCLIKQGLGQANAIGDIKIHVSPVDYDDVLERRDEFLSLAGTGSKIEIFKDLSLNKSDCIIETPYGNIDCSLEQQFISLRENIYYILNNR